MDSSNEWIMVEEDPCTTPVNVSRQNSVDSPSTRPINSTSPVTLNLPKNGKKNKSKNGKKPKQPQEPVALPVANDAPKSRKARMAALREQKATQERLWEASKVGSMDGVQRALAAGADVNAIDDREAGEHEHVPAIVHCAVGCYANIIEVLLEAGASVEGCNAHGVTALMEAASAESTRTTDKGKAKMLETIELLIARGADVNAVDCDGESALFKAAQEGCEKSVKLLLNRGADPKLTDSRGRDATQMAANGGHEKLAMLLQIVSKTA